MKSRTKDTLFFSLGIILDFLTLCIAFSFAYWLRHFPNAFPIYSGPIQFHYFVFISAQIIFVWILVGYFAGAYDTKKIYPLPEQFYDIFRNTLISTVVALAMTFFYRPFSYSRLVLVLAFFLTLIFVAAEKMFFRTLKTYLFNKEKFLSRILIIGENPILKKTIEVIKNDEELGLKIVEVIENTKVDSNTKFREKLSKIPDMVRHYNVEFIVMAFPFEKYREIKDVFLYCRDLHINFMFVPDLFEIMISKANAFDLNGMPFFILKQAPLEGWYGFVKRIIDIIFSIFFLIITAPLFVLIPIAIKIESKGPVFYLQERVGKNEQIFKIIKFRSMFQNAEEKTGPVWANGRKDPRVTKIGRILRVTHLDEIPQLFNVFRNNMSLVGPRPERPVFVEKLKNQVSGYTLRHAVKPGLTGIAQLEHKPDTTVEDVKIKLQYDRYYMENATFKLDFIILARTIFGFLKGRK